MELVKIDPNEFGLEENRAKEISAQFKPMLDKMEELEEEYNNVISLPIDETTCKKAKELRLKYVKVRTGTAKIHKEQKAFYVAGGKYVDGWKNAQLFASKGIEENLKKIEDYYENIEKERLDKLKQERASKLAEFEQFDVQDAILQLNDDAFEIYLNGVKTKYEADQKAIKEAEEEAKKLEVKKQLFEERKNKLRPYMSFIPNEMFVGFDVDTSEDDYMKMLNTGKFNKIEHENKEKELAEERKKVEAENKRLEAERRKLEAEKKALKESEAVQKIAKAGVQALSSIAPPKPDDTNYTDKEKMQVVVENLEEIIGSFEYETKEYEQLGKQVDVLLTKVINHINKTTNGK